MELNKRSEKKELLDRDDIPSEELYLNLKELDVINRFLGGYNASQRALREISTIKKVKNVLDVGFGGGDFIRELDKVNEGKMFFYGADLKQECVEYAQRNLILLGNKKLLQCDFRDIDADLLKDIDVIHCSLFAHHLKNDEIIQMMRFAKENNCAIIINDLHRHWFAYHSIKVMTGLFSSSRLVKHDAPLSVARAFTAEELKSFVNEAGYKNHSLTWNWAFRYTLSAWD